MNSPKKSAMLRNGGRKMSPTVAACPLTAAPVNSADVDAEKGERGRKLVCAFRDDEAHDQDQQGKRGGKIR